MIKKCKVVDERNGKVVEATTNLRSKLFILHSNESRNNRPAAGAGAFNLLPRQIIGKRKKKRKMENKF